MQEKIFEEFIIFNQTIIWDNSPYLSVEKQAIPGSDNEIHGMVLKSFKISRELFAVMKNDISSVSSQVM